MEVLLTNWGVFSSIGSIVCVIAITVHATRRNTSALESLKQKEISELYEKNLALNNKVNDKMDTKEARETFVTKEVNTEQMKHIDTSIAEIKEYQKEILGYLRK